MNNAVIWMLILSILSILSGVVLSRKGVPYKPLLSTLHKITSFALGLIYILAVYVQVKAWGITFLPLLTAIFAIAFFIVSVVSGSILISNKSENRTMQLTHRATSILSFGIGIYSLFLVDIL